MTVPFPSVRQRNVAVPFGTLRIRFQGHHGSLPHREPSRERQERRREVAQVRLVPHEGRFFNVSVPVEQGAETTVIEPRRELSRHDDGAFMLQALREDLGGLDGAQQGACEDDGRCDAFLADPAGDLPESGAGLSS